MSSDEDEALGDVESGLPRSASLPVLPDVAVQHERTIIHVDIDCFYAQVCSFSPSTANVTTIIMSSYCMSARVLVAAHITCVCH
jgi:hypothetical protein